HLRCHAPPCRPPRRSTLLPYTTLFRSPGVPRIQSGHARCPRSTPSRPTPWPSTSRMRCSTKRAPLGTPTRRRRQSPQSGTPPRRSEEHTSELQSLRHLVCRLLLEKKKQ